MSVALDYSYHYPFASSLERSRLVLATSQNQLGPSVFFQGRILAPRAVATQLLALTDVVRTHYFLPRPALLDPVLTSSREVLRIEGFSGCCGVYARIDLDSQAIEGGFLAQGTTNVDFNEPMRQALMAVTDRESVRISVGNDGVSLDRDGAATVEKKVKLPVRWLKSFAQIPQNLKGLTKQFSLNPGAALRSLRALPGNRDRAAQKALSLVVRGQTLQAVSRPKPSSITVCGTHRLAVLESLLPLSQGLDVWFDSHTQVSGWEVHLPTGRFFLLLSPEVHRGFSGEGQELSDLAVGAGEDLLSSVRAQFRWQSQIDSAELAQSLGVEQGSVEGALTHLGTRGLTGFDVHTQAYYHRELPFDRDMLTSLSPRLKGASRLIEEGRVERISDSVFRVFGDSAPHRVQLAAEGSTCTCPWFSKYLGARGPCKHLLAAEMADSKDPRQ